MSRRGAALAALLLLSSAQAQDGQPEQPAAGGGTSLRSWFSGLVGSDKPVLEKLSGKPYVVSNQAMGIERDVLNQRAAGYGLMQMQELQQYANRVLDKLKRASGIPGLAGTVYLRATDDMSAVTTADGNIYISYRWFENINHAQYKRGQEDTLAALLAHELGHVALGHHNSDLWSKAEKWVKQYYAEGVALKMALEKQGNANAATPLPANAANNLQRMQLMIEITDRMLHPAWKRGQESEADNFAIDVTNKAGYSYQEGFKRFLEINNSVEQIRIERDAAKLKEMQAEVDGSLKEGKLDAALNKLGKQVTSHLGTMLGAGHPDPVERTRDMVKYVQTHYKSDWYEDAEAGVSTEYRAVAMQKKTMELFDLYNTVFEHEGLINSMKPEDLQNAIRLGAKMTQKIGARNINQDNWLLYYEYYRALQYGSAQVEQAALLAPAPPPPPAKAAKSGKPGAKAVAAAAPVDPVLRMEEVQAILLSNASIMSFKPYEDSINWELKRGRRDKALAILADTDKKFELARSTLPKTIAFYSRAGKPERAQELVAYCTVTYIDSRDECANAAKAP